MAITATLTFRLGSYQVIYSLANFDCCTGGTLTLADAGGCPDAPATIVLSPCGDHCGPCPLPGIDACDCTGVPQTLYAHFSEPNTTVELTYNSGNAHWEYTGTVCGLSISIAFYCYSSPSWAFEITGDFTDSDTNIPIACDPFQWQSAVPLLSGGSCGSGSTVTITETPP